MQLYKKVYHSNVINVYFGGRLANLGPLNYANLDYSNVVADKDSELAHIIVKQPPLPLNESVPPPPPQKFGAFHRQIVSQIGDSTPLKNGAYAKDREGSNHIVATESKFGVPIKIFQFHPEVAKNQDESEV